MAAPLSVALLLRIQFESLLWNIYSTEYLHLLSKVTGVIMIYQCVVEPVLSSQTFKN